MQISENGLHMIEQFEGLRLNAYKVGKEKFYTIGYGHAGSDVTAGMTITQEQAETYLRQDVKEAEAAVSHPKTYNGI